MAFSTDLTRRKLIRWGFGSAVLALIPFKSEVVEPPHDWLEGICQIPAAIIRMQKNESAARKFMADDLRAFETCMQDMWREEHKRLDYVRTIGQWHLHPEHRRRKYEDDGWETVPESFEILISYRRV